VEARERQAEVRILTEVRILMEMRILAEVTEKSPGQSESFEVAPATLEKEAVDL